MDNRSRSKDNSQPPKFKICSYNCNGLNDFKKRKDVFDFLRKQNSNILLLQETHLPYKLENFIRSNWGYTVWLAGSDTNQNGVAILFENNFEHKVHNAVRDPEGHFLMLDIEILDKRITLVNVYGPSSGDNQEFFYNLSMQIDGMGNDNIIIGGDWNVAMDPRLDYRNYANIHSRPRSRKQILT